MGAFFGGPEYSQQQRGAFERYMEEERVNKELAVRDAAGKASGHMDSWDSQEFLKALEELGYRVERRSLT